MEIEKILAILGIIFFIVIGFSVLMLLVLSGFDISISGNRIAVINLEGTISSSGDLFSDTITARFMNDLFEEVGDDPSIVGVILKIDSGGGAVVASKEIARGLEKLREKKPVVSWIGSIGASGAYYIISASDVIVADEDSIVGGIGVISTYSIYKDLLEEKLGINTTVIKSGKFKDMGSPYRAITEEEKERLQEIVDIVHEEFLQYIWANRGLTRAAISEIKEGGIYLGSEALELGLVDEVGGFDTALEIVRYLAGTPDAEPYYIEEEYYLADLMELSYGVGRGIGDSLSESLETNQFNRNNLEY